MIENGKLLESISERFAIVKTNIHQSGFLGLLNVNKHCEGFVRDLLNIVFDYELVSLPKANFPGIDLGDKPNGVAFQVTSEKGSDKVNDMLDKSLKHEHYKTYQKFFLFLLSNRQGTYTVTVETEPHFTFDWKENIMDFDILLREIQNTPFKKLKAVSEYLNEQLPGMTEILKTGKSQESPIDTQHLLDPTSSMLSKNMTSFRHECVELSANDPQLTVRQLYNKLFDFFSANETRVAMLPILHKPWQMPGGGNKEILFNMGVQATGISNKFVQYAMKITAAKIRLEFAEYSDNAPLLTNYAEAGKGLFSLLFFFSTQTNLTQHPLKIKLSIEANNLTLFSLVNSPLSIKQTFTSHKLTENKWTYDREITSLTDNDLNNISQSVLDAFEITEKNHLLDHPFLELDEANAQMTWQYFRNLFNITNYGHN